MPAKSEKQARLFRLVRALQKGGIKSKEVSPQVRKMAKTIKPSSVRHFTKVKEIIQKLKESEFSLGKIEIPKTDSLKKHLSKQVGVPFDDRDRSIFQTKENGFSGFGKTKFEEDKQKNEIFTEISSNGTNKKYVFKKLIDNEDKNHVYACIIQIASLDKSNKKIIDMVSNSFDNNDVSDKTKTLNDFIDRINSYGL